MKAQAARPEPSGRLTPIELTHRDANGGQYWRCRCTCGAVVEVRRDHLETKRTRSCGCFQREWARQYGIGTRPQPKRYIDRNAYLAVWREENRERVRKQLSEWKKRHPDRVTAEQQKRETRKRQAMPSWADESAIARIYKTAREATVATGVKHHVDHIVPLVSPIICGLHVAHNLQVLTATENVKKYNKLNDARLWKSEATA